MADTSKPKNKKKAVKSAAADRCKPAVALSPLTVETVCVASRKHHPDPRRRIRRAVSRMDKLRREAAANKRADAARTRSLKLLSNVRAYFAELDVREIA